MHSGGGGSECGPQSGGGVAPPWPMSPSGSVSLGQLHPSITPAWRTRAPEGSSPPLPLPWTPWDPPCDHGSIPWCRCLPHPCHSRLDIGPPPGEYIESLALLY